MTPRSRTGLALLLVAGWLASPLSALARNAISFTAAPAVLSSAGGTITFTVALDYDAPATALSLQVASPNASWTYGTTGGASVPEIVPRAGDTGHTGDGYGFLYFNVPAQRATFTFTLKYPARLTEPQTFHATATLAGADGVPTVLPAAVTLGPTALAPAIATQPADATATIGGSATFSVIATGSSPLSYQWRKSGEALPGETASTLTLSPVQAASAGTYDVVVTSAAGSITSRAVRLTVTTATSAPAVLAQPQPVATAAGGSVTFAVSFPSSTSTTYSWQRLAAGATTWTTLANSTGYAGVKTPALTVRGATLAMNGDQFRCVITTASGSVVSVPATLTVAPTAAGAPTPTEPADARLVNLSVRATAGTGDQALIVGFVIGGAGSKQVLVRGIGPTLNQFGVSGTLPDPMLTLFNAASEKIGANDNWGGAAAASRAFTDVGAFSLPSSSKDAVLSVALPAGASSAQVNGVGGATGLSLAEVYDADPKNAAARFVNLAARNHVGRGDALLVVGFAIQGTANATVLIRGIGPTLAQFGVASPLADPQVRLFNQSGEPIQENDNWAGAAELQTTFERTGAFGLAATSKDAALIATLPPGIYTAQVSGVADTTGIALVEVYEIR